MESVTTGEEAAPVDSKKNQSKSSLKSSQFRISVWFFFRMDSLIWVAFILTTADSAPAHHQTELNIFISTNSHKSITNQPVPQIPKSSNSYLLDNEPTGKNNSRFSSSTRRSLTSFISTNSHKSITNQPVPTNSKSSNSYLLDNEPTVLRLILRDTDECRFRAEPRRCSSIPSRHAGFYFPGMLRVKKVGLTP
ncbi:hypothetical protein CDAR_212841 [Caerostris darwini]|uniref:Uncharacterized protein n=1 Tax=Caerostris darwini TaxID=1538125 RepID=A0AAV4MDW5_9ARAC|nr:hypothetical protein CDAR_212841 [Caerostris darwini]